MRKEFLSQGSCYWKIFTIIKQQKTIKAFIPSVGFKAMDPNVQMANRTGLVTEQITGINYLWGGDILQYRRNEQCDKIC